MIRCKFMVTEIAKLDKYCWNGEKSVPGERLIMTAVASKDGENSIFGKVTPSGSIQFVTSNLDKFELGAEYYVDFAKVE